MIYCIQASHHGPVKIGYVDDSSTLDKRLSSIQVGTPEEVYVLAILPGDRKKERDLHKRFADGRLRGEWFEWSTPGLAAFISDAVQREALRAVAADRSPV